MEAADAGIAGRLINARARDIAPSSPAARVYATRRGVAAAAAPAIYRSDDAGETWARSTDRHAPDAAASTKRCRTFTRRIADTLIVTDIVSFKSTDGGRTFVPFKGAPGGDDYQNIWWNPNNPDIMLLVADQGAVVTLNGGQTWSSWYTQSTAALYHVMTDNAFPYRVCGGQQDSGSVCVASRGNDGQITFREWHPVGVEEYGYAAPDPLDPDLVYGGKVTRYDRRTGQVSRCRARPPDAAGAAAAADACVPHCADAAGRLFDGRPARAVLRQQRALEDARRRPQLDADQPRPDARDVGRAEERRHLRSRVADTASAAQSAPR